MGRIERFLAHEAGAPFYKWMKWSEGRNNRPSKRPEERERERYNLALALRRFQTRSSLRLAERLFRCRTGARCVSGACPVCQSAAQRLFVYAARNVFDEWESISAVTAVWHRAGVSRERLGEVGLFDRITARVRRACEETGTRAFGGFDMSLNVHETQHFDPHYQPHAHLFCESAQFQKGREVFDGLFPSIKQDCPVLRPLQESTFDGQRRGYAYAIKPDMFKRVSLAPRVPKGRYKGNTRMKPLPEVERCRLALELDQEGLDARFFFVGCRLRLNRNLAEIRIVRNSWEAVDSSWTGLDRLHPNTSLRLHERRPVRPHDPVGRLDRLRPNIRD